MLELPCFVVIHTDITIFHILGFISPIMVAIIKKQIIHNEQIKKQTKKRIT